VDDNLLLSVIIPVYNGERYLAEALESVLLQTYCPGEVIVVDDGSTDGSAEVARSFAAQVTLCTQPHSGAAAARNKGIELSRGSLLAFLDADDLWVEDKLMRQAAVLHGRPTIDMVFAHVVHFLSPDIDRDVRARIHCPPQPEPGFVPGAMLIRRKAFQRVGPFETGWRVGEFIDWHARAVDAGLTGVMLPQVLLRRRLHAENTGIRQRGARKDYARILKATLDRRRGTEGRAGRRGQSGADDA
jgi:glycosyltransferase involved in cell wall biosynthesis